MTDLRLRTRTTSELVDAAFSLYRRHAMQYILVGAIGYSPFLILQLVTTGTAPTTPAALFASGGTALVLMLASMITFSLMSGVVIKHGAQVYLGGEPDLAKTVREVIPRLPSLIVAGLLSALLYGLGLLFFLVGVFYIIARYFAVSSAVVLEERGPFAALGRSSELSRDRKRHILNTLLLVFLIYFILSMGIGAFSQIFRSQVLQLVVTTTYTIVAYPVISLTYMVLYYDARIRGEGFDLEHMAKEIDAAGATPSADGPTR